MFKRVVYSVVLAFTIVSCQFTETLVLNEDGSGIMSIEMDMSEMMAFGAMGADTTVIKMDTIINIKDILIEKKDSIATLSAEQQQRYKAMENYSLNLKMDSEAGIMVFDMHTNFKNISEANNLMNGLEKSGDFIPGMSGMEVKNEESENSSSVTGVSYTYTNGSFKRDNFIIDKEKHKKQVDSMQSAESFMSSMKYKLKYTFPKKIKKSSIEDATYSLDGKTIEIERAFIDYFKNPDILDLEIELEK
jgi:hypothetical protein